MAITEARKRMNEKYKWVVENGLWILLKTRGFKRKRFLYWRDLESGITHAVAPNRSPRTESHEVNFTLDCGVTVHAFWDLYAEGKWSRTPSVNGSQLYVRPAAISDFKLTHDWWRLDADASEQALASIAVEIRDAFAAYVLPWFDRFQTPRAVGDYLATREKGPGRNRMFYRDVPQAPFDLRKAAIAYFGAGDYGRAREMLDLATITIDRHGKGQTADLRDRMERLIAQRQAGHAKP